MITWEAQHFDPEYTAKRFGYSRPLREYFWDRVERMESGCWEWRGGTRNGYGRLWVDGHLVSAHRVAFELVRGPIPDGLTLDHLCVNPICVNPAHLDPVPVTLNTLRGRGPTAHNAKKLACKRGHAFTAENTGTTSQGHRICRACNAMRTDWRKVVRLQEWRKRRSLSQAELARLAGITKATLVRIEMEHTRPQPLTTRKLAAALGIDPEELLEPRNEPLPDAH